MLICWLSQKKKKIYTVLEFGKLEYCRNKIFCILFIKGTRAWYTRVLCCMLLEFTKFEYHIIFFNCTNPTQQCHSGKTNEECEFQPRDSWMASCPILLCSAPASMTLQLLACLARVQLLAAGSRESLVRSSRESLFFLPTLEHFFTLSHSLPLQESHLNTGLLISEIQANLAWNKANKMVD